MALLIGVPIALGAARFPADEAPALQQMATQSQASSPFISLPPLDEDLNLLDESGFRLITPKIRNEFLAEKIAADTFTMELVKAEFFRREVPYGAIIYREARRHGLQPELIAAVVEAESDFRPHLQSPRNAMGLMQIVPSTGVLMGGSVDSLFDPAENVRLGAKYLRYLTDRFGHDQRLILAAYNAGESTVRKYGGVPPYPETQNYLLRVARCKQKFHHRLNGQVSELSEMISADSGL